MAIIFDGKKEAERILKNLKKEIKKTKIQPHLAVILVGDNRASKLYIKRKKETAKRVGIKLSLFEFKRNSKEEKIIQKIKELNRNKKIQGIIVQLPLPSGFDEDKIISVIDPRKDVDGFHKENLKLLKKGKPFLFPVLLLSIFTALKKAGKNFKNKKIIALVNSEILGRALKIFLAKEKIKVNYFVKNLPAQLRSADVIITARGKAGIIKGKMIKEKVILIDAGFIYTKERKLTGDVDKESCAKKAYFLTPVPGGIGPLTVVFLLRNVYLAAKKQYTHD